MPSVTKSVRNVRDKFSGRRRSSTMGMTVVSEATAPAPLPMAAMAPPSEVPSVTSLRSDRSSVAPAPTPTRTTQPAQSHHRNLTAPPPTARTPMPQGRMSPAVQHLSTRIEDMHLEVNNKTSEITDLQFKIKNDANGTEGELNALRQESERLRRDRVNYQNRMDEMQRQQDKLLQELAEMRKDFKKQRDAGSDVVRILQREQQTREEDWQREAHELRSLLTSLKYSSNDVEEGTALRRNHESAVASIGDVVMGQDKLKQFRLKEAVRINAITKRQEEQEAALQQTQESLEKLLADREKHVTNVKTMEGQHEELKQKIEEASGKTDAMREEIVADLGARDREVKRLLLETAELRKLQSSDEAHIVMLERKLNAESHEVDQLYREAEALRRKQRMEKKLLNEMQSLHIEEERMLQEMDTELQQQNRRLRHTEKEIDMVDKKLESVAKRPQEFVEEHHHHHHHRTQRVEVEKPIEIHRIHQVEVVKEVVKPVEIHHFHSNVPVRRVYA